MANHKKIRISFYGWSIFVKLFLLYNNDRTTYSRLKDNQCFLAGMLRNSLKSKYAKR